MSDKGDDKNSPKARVVRLEDNKAEPRRATQKRIEEAGIEAGLSLSFSGAGALRRAANLRTVMSWIQEGKTDEDILEAFIERGITRYKAEDYIESAKFLVKRRNGKA